MTEPRLPPPVVGFGPPGGPPGHGGVPPGGSASAPPGHGGVPPGGSASAPPGGFSGHQGGSFGPLVPPPPGSSSPTAGFGVPPGNAQALAQSARNWLLGALATSLLCGGGCLLGLTGAVMCFLAQRAAEQGHLADAQQKLRWGQILTLSGLAVGMLVVVGFFALR